MPEWWTYSLADFLLFSPRTYYRLIERHNIALWPGQLVALGLGLLLVYLVLRPPRRQGRAVSAILALLWAWVGWSFMWRRYATINWAARYFVLLFAIEALLLIAIGMTQGGRRYRWGGDPASVVGAGLLAVGLLFYPALAPLAGRGWSQAEVIGVAPDPTAIATLGLLLLGEGPLRWSLLIPPIVWCLIGGATLLAMGSPEAWVVLSTPLLATGTAVWSWRRSRNARM